MSKKKVNIHFNVIAIGAGGTGGNFAKEFARYLSYLDKPNVSVTFSLVDGDRVEESNCSRQPYTRDDVALNKSVALVDAIKDVFELNNVYSYPDYILDADDLLAIEKEHEKYSRLYYYSNSNKDMVILIGGVDNHRARQVMDEYFKKSKNIIYIDSANEFSVGEVCIGARMNGREIAPPRSYYFPDVLTDKSPTAAELSCGTLNISAPQHIATNLMASNLMLSVITDIISNGIMSCGIIFFDTSKCFSKFVPFEKISSGRKGAMSGEST